MTPENCMGPVIDNITINNLTARNLITTKDLNVTGTITTTNIIETLIIKTNILEEYTAGSGITVSDPLILPGPGTVSRYNVYDQSGTILRGQVIIAGSSPSVDSAIRFTSSPNGAFIFEGATVPYMTLLNAGGTGRLLVDEIYPNADTQTLISAPVIGYSTETTPGGIRYNANALEVCNNSGVWVSAAGISYVGGSNISIVGNTISLVTSPSVTSLTATGAIDGQTLSITNANNTPNFISATLANSGTLDPIWTIKAARGSDVSNAPGSNVVRMGMYYGNNPLAYTNYYRGTDGTRGYMSFHTDNTQRLLITGDGGVDITGTRNLMMSLLDSATTAGTNKTISFGQSLTNGNAATLGLSWAGNNDVANHLRIGLVGNETAVQIFGTSISLNRATSISSRLTVPEIVSPVTFLPSTFPPVTTTTSFLNAPTGLTTAGFKITPTSGSDCNIGFIGTGTHRMTSNINATPDVAFTTLSQNGAVYDYMTIGQTSPITPSLGSIVANPSGYIRAHNGTTWKNLTPMDTGTLRVEASGVSCTPATPFSIVPATGDSLDARVCDDTGAPIIRWTGGGVFANVYVDRDSYSQIHNLSSGPISILNVNNNFGAVFNYITIGQNSVSTPLAGAIRTVFDTTNYLDFYNGDEWERLATKKSAGAILGMSRFSIAGLGGTASIIALSGGPKGSFTGWASGPNGDYIDITFTPPNGIANPATGYLITYQMVSTSNSAKYIPITGSLDNATTIRYRPSATNLGITFGAALGTDAIIVDLYILSTAF